jgi:hypothetical protein
MKHIECSREQDLIDAVESQRWPDRIDDDLRSHVAGCSVCADVVEVVRALHSDRDAAMENVQIPCASVVWWRAEVQARQDAAEAAARPITLVQGFAVASTLGVSLALLGAVTPGVGEWFNGLAGILFRFESAACRRLGFRRACLRFWCWVCR